MRYFKLYSTETFNLLFVKENSQFSLLPIWEFAVRGAGGVKLVIMRAHMGMQSHGLAGGSDSQYTMEIITVRYKS